MFIWLIILSISVPRTIPRTGALFHPAEQARNHGCGDGGRLLGPDARNADGTSQCHDFAVAQTGLGQTPPKARPLGV
jgi:hypothetical protein